MIFTTFIYLISGFLRGILWLLPTWQVWPDSLLNGLTYFCTALYGLNIILPIDTLFTVMIFMINFEIAYLGAKLIMKLFNYVRGTGSGLDI